MFNRRFFLALSAFAILCTSTAFAGSGGTKKDATISLRNDSSGPIAAFVDPDSAKISKLAAISSPTEADIVAAGGQLVNPGAIVSFKVSAGTYSLVAGPSTSSTKSASVTIGKGQAKNYAFTNASSALVLY